MRKILITGGAGFIGSNFIRYLLTGCNNCNIINFDKLTYAANLHNLKDVEQDPRYKFIKGDICDKRSVMKAAQGCEAIINFAAESHVDRSIKDPSAFLRTNIDGVRVLLDTARECNIPKFVQISTDEVYGSVAKGYSREGNTLNPSNPYSASKAAADLLCLSYHNTYKLPVVITRSSNNFGEYQFPEKIVPLFITNGLEGNKVPLYADGLNRRDWIYVIDNCEAINLVLKKGKPGEVYNIGGGNEKTNIALTRQILKILGKDESFIEYVKDRPGHDKRYSVACNKLRRLGWRPRCDFNKALEATVGWYKNNESWWRPLKKRVA